MTNLIAGSALLFNEEKINSIKMKLLISYPNANN